MRMSVKAGPVEFEYEGAMELSLSDFEILFSHLEILISNPNVNGGPKFDVPIENEAAEPSVSDRVPIKLQVNSIASKLGGSSSAELAIAAAAYLQIVEQKSSFSRNELIDQMKSATYYYKKNMVGNLSSTLTRLINNNKFNEIAKGRYSLSAETKRDIGVTLADN